MLIASFAVGKVAQRDVLPCPCVEPRSRSFYDGDGGSYGILVVRKLRVTVYWKAIHMILDTKNVDIIVTNLQVLYYK